MGASTLRVLVIIAATAFNRTVMRPPSQSASNVTDILKKYSKLEDVGPLGVKLMEIVSLIFALHEVVTYLVLNFASSSSGLVPEITPSVCPATSPNLVPAAFFFFSVLFELSGTFIRRLCFAELGRLFTFTLTIQKDHKLVKSGPYSYVRHPSYTGVLLIAMGLALQYLFPDSHPALVECGIIPSLYSSMRLQLCVAVYWSLVLLITVRRTYVEDSELRSNFGSEWEDYAAKVRYRLIPFVF